MVKCSGIDCPNDAEKLKCPTCVKLGLPEAYFCNQQCFKDNWPVHKLFHLAKQQEGRTPEKFLGFSFSGPLRPGEVTPMRTVPSHIVRPEYAETGVPLSEKRENPAIIPVYTPEQIEKIRTVCRMAREVLDLAATLVKPGVTGEEIDELVHIACIERNAYPSPLNYYNFPKSCCVSVNEVICHGIPDNRKLEDGDIVNIDVTLFYDGVHGDVNETYLVGEVDEASKLLVKTTRECLDKAIEIVKPGTMYRQIGEVITRHASRNNLSVVRSYCGHGIGMLFHCAPNVPHYAKNKAVGVMKPGHIFTIEPMINIGTWKDRLWPDDWTSTTMDGKRSAQFEETLLVTEDGVEILTGRR